MQNGKSLREPGPGVVDVGLTCSLPSAVRTQGLGPYRDGSRPPRLVVIRVIRSANGKEAGHEGTGRR
jgi:hypothetical protein